MRKTTHFKTLIIIGLLIAVLTVSVFANPFKMSGKSRTKVFRLPPGLYLFEINNKGFSKFNFVVKNEAGVVTDVLASGVGPFKGRKVVAVNKPADAEEENIKVKRYMEATEADGEWVASVFSTIAAKEGENEFSGETNTMDATPTFKLEEGKYLFTVGHKGGRNFSAYLIDSRGRRVAELANSVGHFTDSTTVNIPAEGTYIVQIKASGKWNVSFGKTQ